MRRALATLPVAVLLTLAPSVARAEGDALLDAATRQRVASRLAAQRTLASRREEAVFSSLSKARPGPEREALEFLLAFAPLGDLAETDGDFFLRVARTSLEARRTMPWGARVPPELFLRYVLPPRVNTESLDGARWVLFDALRDRLRGLSLEEAVLEVNHFCHEHVTYRPADLRTSAPLATMRTTWGRCGEESTFVVSALRAVGIPARQVYTPRWAHVDDNHAWVEAWVDGRWRYLGACEPEPRLDLGWFTEPVRRAVLVHTKAFGGALPGEETIVSTPWYDELNLTARYAKVAERRVRVVDERGAKVEGARVSFCLYNAAELFPLATKTTGKDGSASLTAGRGDLVIRATKGRLSGIAISRGGDAETTVTLGPESSGESRADLDLHPPKEPWPEPAGVSPAARAENQKRFAREDALRRAKRAGFPKRTDAERLAAELGLPAADVSSILARSHGNHEEIAAFLRETPSAQRGWAMALLGTVSDKDLRDTPAAVLRDLLEGPLRTPGDLREKDRALFVEAVLSPRVAHELLRPHRAYLQDRLREIAPGPGAPSPDAIARWVRENVAVDEAANWYGVPVSPRGTFDLRVADPLSRDVLFVALCRAAGHPARLDPASRAPEVARAGTWKTVALARTARPPDAPASLTLTASGEPLTYGLHFGLARLEAGRATTLDLDGKVLSGSWPALALGPGRYELTTGTRLVDGSVLARQRSFRLASGERKVVAVERRAAPVALPVLAKAPSPLAAGHLDGAPHDLAPALAPRGLILAWVAQGHEPSSHALSDLARLRRVLEAWRGSVVVALEAQPAPEAPLPTAEFDLPDGTALVLDDRDSELRRAVASALGRPPGEALLPEIVVITPAGDIVFHSTGYRIGVGEQLLAVVRHLEQRFPLPPIAE